MKQKTLDCDPKRKADRIKPVGERVVSQVGQKKNLFGEPRTEEGHVERVGVRVDGAERVGADGAHQRVDAARQLIANWNADDTAHGTQTERMSVVSRERPRTSIFIGHGRCISH